MSSRALFKDKQLRLCVVTTLAAGPAVSTAEALLLPPKPLAFSSTWDCRSGHSNDWLCRMAGETSYSQPLESVTQDSTSNPERRYGYQPSRMHRSGYDLAAAPHSTSSLQFSSHPAVVDRAILVELINAPPESYVLQWLAANEREPLEQLKKQYPILQDAAIAQYQRSGRQWFILLEGPFPSRIAAMAALKHEPRASIASRFYPWTRSIASIQQLDFVHPEQFVRKPYVEEQEWNGTRQSPAKAKQPISPMLQGYYEAGVGYDNSAHHFTPSLHSRRVETLRKKRRGYSDESPSDVLNGEMGYLEQAAPDAYPAFNAYVPDRYGYAKGIADINASIQLQPEQLSLFAPDGERKRGYQGNPQKAKNSRFHRPHALSDRRLNDLSYATASVTPSMIMPPTYNQQTAPSHTFYNHLQPNHRYEHSAAAYDHPSLAASEKNDYFPAEVRKDTHLNFRQPYIDTALHAPVGSYTIQWLAANNKASLERMKLRYPQLQNSKIIHYRRRNSDWYVLVGGTFASREAAQSALSMPPYSRLTARLYPWIRSVESLQKMVADTAKKKPASYGQYNSPLQKFMSESDNSYTIQWYAADRLEAVMRMKSRFPELADAVTVHFRRNERDWYVLLQGQYSTSQDANSAIKAPAMQDAARMLHPWTRPLNSLKHLNFQEQS